MPLVGVQPRLGEVEKTGNAASARCGRTTTAIMTTMAKIRFTGRHPIRPRFEVWTSIALRASVVMPGADEFPTARTHPQGSSDGLLHPFNGGTCECASSTASGQEET